ncbi:MAG: hypothetical protein JW801_18145 [Bacteroidales bacterium]|nr:hypothetical protein [Bacteroidales bacterium]
MNLKKKLYIIVPIGIIVLIQLIRIDSSSPETDPKKDLLNQADAPSDISNILKSPCDEAIKSLVKWLEIPVPE